MHCSSSGASLWASVLCLVAALWASSTVIEGSECYSASPSISSSLTAKCGGYVCPLPSANYFLLWVFRLIFFRTSRQFSVQIEIFRKNTFFCPTTTFSWLCSSDDPCMENMFLVGFFWSRRDLLVKEFGVRRSSQKLRKLFPQAFIYLRSAMLIYRLKTPQVKS